MHTELRQTGWGWPHATWYCPSCHKEYWQRTKKEDITPEKPFAWPGKKQGE